jgi:hypothetical protein
MKLIGFSVRKPRAFSYKPRYYDERKERIEELKKKYNEERTGNSEISPDFREKLRASFHVKEKRIGTISKTTVLIYLAIVLLIIYIIFLR